MMALPAGNPTIPSGSGSIPGGSEAVPDEKSRFQRHFRCVENAFADHGPSAIPSAAGWRESSGRGLAAAGR